MRCFDTFIFIIIIHCFVVSFISLVESRVPKHDWVIVGHSRLISVGDWVDLQVVDLLFSADEHVFFECLVGLLFSDASYNTLSTSLLRTETRNDSSKNYHSVCQSFVIKFYFNLPRSEHYTWYKNLLLTVLTETLPIPVCKRTGTAASCIKMCLSAASVVKVEVTQATSKSVPRTPGDRCPSASPSIAAKKIY